MHTFTRTGILLTIALALFQPVGESAMVVDSILFGSPLAIRDSSSGNDYNFAFVHPFGGFDFSDKDVLSASIRIEHESNSDEGPIRELWFLRWADNTEIGRLSESNGDPVLDTFEVPINLFETLNAEDFAGFQLRLAEETSFNGETLHLYSSEMSLEYTGRSVPDETPGAIPQSPEPDHIFLLGLLAGTAVFFLRKYFSTAF